MKIYRFVTDAALILIIMALYALTEGNGSAEYVSALSGGGPIYRGSSDSAVAMEFAVEWEAAAVPDILDTLKENGVKASFAISGEYARKQADAVKRMRLEGHEIITMGYDPDTDGPTAKIKADIEKSMQAIYEVTGEMPELYYSGERRIEPSNRAARELGLTHVLSTVDLRCSSGNAENIVERGLNNPIIGSIILLQPTTECAKALSGLIRGFETKGITVTTVSCVMAGNRG